MGARTSEAGAAQTHRPYTGLRGPAPGTPKNLANAHADTGNNGPGMEWNGHAGGPRERACSHASLGGAWGGGGKHDEGLRGVQDTSAATFMQLRTARRARAAGCGAVGAGPCTAPSTLEERPAAGGRAAGAALEHDMAVRSGRERAPGRRPHDEPGALGLAWVRISAARQPPARAASQPSLQRPPPRRPPFVHPPSSCFVTTKKKVL